MVEFLLYTFKDKRSKVCKDKTRKSELFLKQLNLKIFCESILFFDFLLVNLKV